MNSQVQGKKETGFAGVLSDGSKGALGVLAKWSDEASGLRWHNEKDYQGSFKSTVFSLSLSLYV